MHPDEVRAKDPGQNEHVRRAQNNALNVDPYEPWQCFEESVMQVDAARCTNWKKASN